MSLFTKLFGNRPKERGRFNGQFKMLTPYSPTFRKWGGQIYESDLVRAAINVRATHISKLKIDVLGSAKPSLKRKLEKGPNQFQTWSQFYTDFRQS